MDKAGYILLADDNATDVEMVRRALAVNKFANEVVVVEDGEEALDYLYRRGKFHARRQGNPLVVVLDLKMPKVDGLEVLRQIKGDAELRTIPAVMFTSSDESADVTESYRLGVNAFVVKPVDFQQFVKTIHAIGLFWTATNEPPPESRAPHNPQCSLLEPATGQSAVLAGSGSSGGH